MKEKILVVDDEETLRLTLRTRLRAEGFDVEVAADGLDALDKLKKEKFGVVLLDVKMPRMDGLETLDNIVRFHPESDVVMVTSFADLTTAVTSLKKGAKDYLSKPVDSTELVTRLNGILRARASEHSLRELRIQYMSTFLHDLLGPVSSIDSTIDHIMQGKTGAVSDDQQVLLQYSVELADKLTVRIKEMIDLSEFEAGVVVLERAPVDITVLTEAICIRYGILARSKGLEFEKSIDRNLPAVNCDVDKIAQTLNTLLDNAIDYTTKGKIRVSVTKVSKGGESILFSVQDTGIGISPEELPLVFNKYKEQMANKPPEMKKVVLSLAVAKHVIDAHQGKIWAESKPGSGSTFSFTLPL